MDISIANVILKQTYLAHGIVNLQGKTRYFYEMHLLLEYQNRVFKCIHSN